MVITKNWLKEFIDISNISTDEIVKVLNSIGLEVDSVVYQRVPNGVVIGKVLECYKHPDANKLNVCKVDVGKEILQIVCGASNVRAGQYVPVALVGAKLEDIEIKKATLRGVESSGMICSSTEISLPKLNDGIMVLDDSIGELVLGKELCEYDILNDDIIEIELTANRGDCLSIYGICRDIAAYFNLSINIIDEHFKEHVLSIGQVFEVEYDVNVDTILEYKVVDIAELKSNLLIDLRCAIINNYKTPIDNIITYATHSTGVLFNYYPLSFLEKKNNLSILEVKQENSIDVTKTHNQLLNTLGVESRTFDINSEAIVIEAFYIEPDIISQKVYEHKLKTNDVYYRSSRGSEPDISLGLTFCCNLFSDVGCSLYKGKKSFLNDKEKIELTLHIDKINAIIGQEIEGAKVENILKALRFDVKKVAHDTLSIAIPLFRHDIKNIADITEEIVRIIGIDNIKPKPLAMDEKNRENEVIRKLRIKNKIRNYAISNGFFETLTYVFTSRELLEKYSCEVVDTNKDIINPITNDLNTYRTTLAINLLEAVSQNVKQGFKNVALFEIGSIFNKNREEKNSLCFIFSGLKEVAHIKNSAKPQNIDFFEFANIISNIIGNFELEQTEVNNNLMHPYQIAKIIKNNVELGVIYKLHPKVAKDFDIEDTFICEIDFDKLSDDKILAKEISKYQASTRDLSFLVPKDLEYKQIKDTIRNLNIKELEQFNLIDIYSDESLGNNDSLTIRFVIRSYEKTLEENEINNIIDNIIFELKDKLLIGIR